MFFTGPLFGYIISIIFYFIDNHDKQSKPINNYEKVEKTLFWCILIAGIIIIGCFAFIASYMIKLFFYSS